MKKFLNVLKVFAIAMLVVPVAFFIAACSSKERLCLDCDHRHKEGELCGNATCDCDS